MILNAAGLCEIVTTDDPTVDPNKCEKDDARGYHWEAQLGKVARQPCPEPLLGHSRFTLSLVYFSEFFTRWECGLDGDFVTKEPDRGNCTSPWLNDVGDQVLKTLKSKV